MSRGIVPVTHAQESLLVETLGLHEYPVSADLQHHTGTFRGAPATIETRIYRSDSGHVARIATISGPTLEIGNIVCYPSPELCVPVLGADLVSVRDDSLMIAADLSPISTNVSDHEEQYRALEARLQKAPKLPSGGELPQWAQTLFSDHYLYTRGSLSESTAAFDRFAIYSELFMKFLANAPASYEHVVEFAEAQQRYAQIHRDDDTGLRLLGAMFGLDWAKRYLSQALFPDPGVIRDAFSG